MFRDLVRDLPPADRTRFLATPSPAVAQAIRTELNRPTTPAALGRSVWRGWKDAPHLDILDDLIVRAATEGNVRAIVSLPPRHGKTLLLSRYGLAWYASEHPDRRMIVACYTQRLADGISRSARNTITEYPNLLGVRLAKDSKAVGAWDLAGHTGGLIATSIGGSLTGFGGDLIIIDDPIKDRQAAESDTTRHNQREWFTSTLLTRLEPNGSIILVGTRWHEDDLAGWLLAENDNDDEDREPWEYIRIPAICDSHDDPIGREIGEPLWPARMPLHKLEQKRADIGEYDWAALYQGEPTPRTGGMFPADKWQWLDHAPADLTSIVRGWDLASTAGGGDWTAGVLLGLRRNGDVVVLDARRKQANESDARDLMLSTANEDKARYRVPYTIVIPQDPAQAGVWQAADLTRMLTGFTVKVERPTGRKELRASPFASQQQRGLVGILQSTGASALVAEGAVFPLGRHDDLIDAAATAFNAPKPFARATVGRSVAHLQI
jgi:predicted phage terminase large subunit-like protein